MYPIEHLHERTNLDLEPGFLFELTPGCGDQRLPELDAAAGKRPLAPARRVRPLDDEHFAVVDDDRTDADDRLIRILAGHVLIPDP
jgi:hypothetical protein